MAKTILKTLVKARARIAKFEDWDTFQHPVSRVTNPIKGKNKDNAIQAKLLVDSMLSFLHEGLDFYQGSYLHTQDLNLFDLAIEMASGAEV